MAIAKMARVRFIAAQRQHSKALRLFQSFQKVEIDRASLENAPFSAPSGDALIWRENLQRIEKSQAILSGYCKKSGLSKLIHGRKTMSFEQLERQSESKLWKGLCDNSITLDNALQGGRARRAELVRLSEQWRPLRELTVHPKELERLRYAVGLIGLVPHEAAAEFAEELSGLFAGRAVCEPLSSQGNQTVVFLLYPDLHREATQELFRARGVNRLEYPFDLPPAEMLLCWEAEEAVLLEKEARLLSELHACSAGAEQLDLAEEYYRNLLLQEEAKHFSVPSETCFYLSGWILREDSAELTELLRRGLEENAYYLSLSDVTPEELPSAPVALKNNKLFRAFESLTKMYSLPSHDEIDPTPFMAPFYLVFFGMMVADTGYGIALFLATFLIRKFCKPDKELRRNVDLFYYLSFSIIVWGVLYGSFFGYDLPIRLFSPMTDIIPILILSVCFGWIQIMTALAISTFVSLRRKDLPGALSGGVSWMGLLLGITLLVLSLLLSNNQPLFYAGAFLCILAVLLILLVPVIQNKKNPAKGFLKGLYELYGATGYLGDLVSYSRLMALGVAGGSIALAFNTIVNTLPLPFRLTLGILLMTVLHALNIFLSLLGAYVHGIRLQYVEMFGKFYSGGGREFSPFKTVEKHIYINQNTITNTEDSLCQ